ncbi:metallo-phosphoesterase [Vibrio phage D479]
MRIYYLSDIHNDYHGGNYLTELTGDKSAVLVVAGDINSKGRTVRDLEEVADRWLHVIAVPGNHDWWRLAIHEVHKFETTKDNVHVLMDDWLVVEDVVFFGGTAWHSIVTPLDEMNWRYTMNDAKRIRGPQYRRLTGNDIQHAHLNTLKFIEDVKRTFPDLKKVLITHHALCSLSLDERYAGQDSNRWYYSENPELLEGIDVHIHGHIHQECDYEVYGCNVVCNPRAYSQRENPEFGIRIIDTKELT